MNRRVATVFIDVLFALVMVLVLLPHEPEAEDAQIESPGTLIIQIEWASDRDVGVDLWVKSPGDYPVGYSNKGGRVFNLLRDDLGHTGDYSKVNFEVAFTRGLPDGEYAVTVHLFNVRGDTAPMPVSAQASLTPKAGDKPIQLWQRDIVLLSVGQEITLARMTFVAGSLIDWHVMPIRLRSTSAIGAAP